MKPSSQKAEIFFANGSADDLKQDLNIIQQSKQVTEISCKKSTPNHPQLMFNVTVVIKSG